MPCATGTWDRTGNPVQQRWRRFLAKQRKLQDCTLNKKCDGRIFVQLMSSVPALYRLVFFSFERVQKGGRRICSLQLSLCFRENQNLLKLRRTLFLLLPTTILKVNCGQEHKGHSSTKYHNLHTHVYLQQIMIHLLDNTYLSFKYLVLLFLFTITQDHIISTPASTQPPNF